MTTDQLLAIFTAAFGTDKETERAILGLGYQWKALKAKAEASAARGAAQSASQLAEETAQAADKAEQKAQVAFVQYVAGLG